VPARALAKIEARLALPGHIWRQRIKQGLGIAPVLNAYRSGHCHDFQLLRDLHPVIIAQLLRNTCCPKNFAVILGW